MWSRADLKGDLATMVKIAAAQGLYSPDPLLPFDAVPSRELFEQYRSQLLASLDGHSPQNSRSQDSHGL